MGLRILLFALLLAGCAHGNPTVQHAPGADYVNGTCFLDKQNQLWCTEMA